LKRELDDFFVSTIFREFIEAGLKERARQRGRIESATKVAVVGGGGVGQEDEAEEEAKGGGEL
jgi:hypothetical protein